MPVAQTPDGIPPRLMPSSARRNPLQTSIIRFANPAAAQATRAAFSGQTAPQAAPLPSLDQYIDTYSKMVPQAGQNVQRRLWADLAQLDANRQAAANETAGARAAFAQRGAQAQAAQGRAAADVASVQEPDAAKPPQASVTPGASPTGPIVQNQGQLTAGQQAAVNPFLQAIQQRADYYKQGLIRAGETDKGASDSDRALQILQLALNSVQSDQARQDQLAAAAGEEAAWRRRARFEQGLQRESAQEEALRSIGIDMTTKEYDRLKSSPAFRYAQEQFSNPATVTSQAGSKDYFSVAGGGPNFGQPSSKGTFQAFDQKKYLDALRAKNPQLLLALAAEGVLPPELVAQYAPHMAVQPG